MNTKYRARVEQKLIQKNKIIGKTLPINLC